MIKHLHLNPPQLLHTGTYVAVLYVLLYIFSSGYVIHLQMTLLCTMPRNVPNYQNWPGIKLLGNGPGREPINDAPLIPLADTRFHFGARTKYQPTFF
jgi:hypothetical protein